MKLTKSFAAAVFAVTLVAASSLQALASGTSTALTLLYDPANGNMTLQNTTSGTGFYQTFEILSLGDGTIGATSGRPGNIGWMSGSAANVAATGGAFLVSNTSIFGANGQYSQTAAGNIGSGMSGMVLSPWPAFNAASFATNPTRGPAGTYYDLGNIAVLGMTQADLDARFVTDPETSINGLLNPGYFQVSYTTSLAVPGGVTQLGAMRAITAVPEPSTYAMAFAGLAFGGFKMWRKRRTA